MGRDGVRRWSNRGRGRGIEGDGCGAGERKDVRRIIAKTGAFGDGAGFVRRRVKVVEWRKIIYWYSLLYYIWRMFFCQIMLLYQKKIVNLQS